jgi:hypothetical protein
MNREPSRTPSWLLGPSPLTEQDRRLHARLLRDRAPYVVDSSTLCPKDAGPVHNSIAVSLEANQVP